MSLRSRLIRLAHENPALRGDLLPLLAEKHAGRITDATMQAAAELVQGGWEHPFYNTVRKQYTDLEKEVREQQRVLAIHDRTGVGRTEAPTLAIRIAAQLEEMVVHLDAMSKILRTRYER